MKIRKPVAGSVCVAEKMNNDKKGAVVVMINPMNDSRKKGNIGRNWSYWEAKKRSREFFNSKHEQNTA